MNIETIIINAIQQVVLDEQGTVVIVSLSDTFEQTGLDSLAFAVLVATLEDSLGFDPFVLEKDPRYPETVQEFTDLYKKYSNSVA